MILFKRKYEFKIGSDFPDTLYIQTYYLLNRSYSIFLLLIACIVKDIQCSSMFAYNQYLYWDIGISVRHTTASMLFFCPFLIYLECSYLYLCSTLLYNVCWTRIWNWRYIDILKSVEIQINLADKNNKKSNRWW